ncbi:MAG: deoxyribonuclease-4 [Mariniblastus sp.]
MRLIGSDQSCLTATSAKVFIAARIVGTEQKADFHNTLKPLKRWFRFFHYDARQVLPILGAHMSIVGGHHKAVERAAEAGCDCVQIFTAAPQKWPVSAPKADGKSGGLATKNNNQWRAKPIGDDDALCFRESVVEHDIQATLSHTSYLINIGSPDPELRQKSIDALVVELERATQLAVPYVVLHPGSYTKSTEAMGLKRIIGGINKAYQRIPETGSQILLETTAGQGTNLGWQFEQLQKIIEGIKEPERIGVCVDTCHIFAAGYALGTTEEYQQTIAHFDDTVGIHLIKAFHLNDSKMPFGSRKDRHDNIGDGEMGIEPFRHLLNDDRFREIPMYLETPKEDHPKTGEAGDIHNLRVLRELVS